MEYLCGTGTATSARSPGTPAWKRCNRHRAMRSSKSVHFGRPDEASHNVSWGHFPSVRPYAQSPADASRSAVWGPKMSVRSGSPLLVWHLLTIEVHLPVRSLHG